MSLKQPKKTYLSKTQFKKAGIKENFTREQIQEYMKCSESPTYFIEKYVRIVTLDEGLTEFKLRDYQKVLINDCHVSRYNIACYSRQSGKTICVDGYIVWYALFSQDKTIAIVANSQKTAREILCKKIYKMIENIPWFLQQGVTELNMSDISFENGCRIIARSSAEDSLRSYSVNLLYIDEMAFLDNDVQFYNASYPVITAGKTSKIIISSTPHPYKLNLFYKLFRDAQSKKNGFIAHLVTWKDVPGRDEEWKNREIERTSKEQFLCEQECKFASGSQSIINNTKLQTMTTMEPIQVIDNDSFVNPPSMGTIMC